MVRAFSVAILLCILGLAGCATPQSASQGVGADSLAAQVVFGRAMTGQIE